MAAESIFGEIKIGSQLSSAAMAHLAEWMPVYIREIEDQQGLPLGRIPPPKTYTTRNDFESFPEDIMPLSVVVSPGLADPPTKEGDGTYSAWFSLGIGFAAAARDADASRILADIYGAAASKIMLDRPSLGGFAQGVEWVDESYDDLVTEENRTIRACYELFKVFVYGIRTGGAGPASSALPNPATQPGSTWPKANIVVIDAINLG